MTSPWAVLLIQKIRMAYGSGSAGNCNYCMKELENVVLELDETRTALLELAKSINKGKL